MIARIIASLLWVASIEAFGETYAGEIRLPGDPDGLANAQDLLWVFATSKEFA